jgi:isopentenyl diphosphate isomerase/L-lactate dehydrogenase-like FMN-dependent dehydrogenase
MAGPFLKAAATSSEQAAAAIRLLVEQLRVTMFAIGAPNLESLGRAPLKAS